MVDRYLTVGQVAARIQANPETVRRWLRAGRLRGSLPGGDKMGWRVKESDLQRFIDEAVPGAEDDTLPE
jgi:excisionase family DNA binding protein